jgi:hypothetical protein
MRADSLDNYVRWVTHYRKLADEYSEDNPSDLSQKIDLLCKCLVFVGKVSSVVDGDYKRIYAQRKHEQALAEIEAPSPKKAYAEVAVAPLRQEEAELYESMRRWRNAFESTQEEIHGLKLKMRIMFKDGAEDVRV